MKKILFAILACTVVTPLIAQTPAQQAVSFYKQGQAAEKAGDPAAAKAAYLSALKADPKNADARYSLGELRTTGPGIAAKGREEKFGAVTVPAFQLQEATLPEALELLSKILEKESKGAVTPNFVIDDPDKKIEAQKITLNLKSLPAKAVMKYLTEQSGTKVRYDEHAVVVSKR